MSADPKGSLRRPNEYWLACGLCSNSGLILPNPPETGAQAARREGNKLTRAYGWVCWRCVDANKHTN